MINEHSDHPTQSHKPLLAALSIVGVMIITLAIRGVLRSGHDWSVPVVSEYDTIARVLELHGEPAYACSGYELSQEYDGLDLHGVEAVSEAPPEQSMLVFLDDVYALQQWDMFSKEELFLDNAEVPRWFGKRISLLIAKQNAMGRWEVETWRGHNYLSLHRDIDE